MFYPRTYSGFLSESAKNMIYFSASCQCKDDGPSIAHWLHPAQKISAVPVSSHPVPFHSVPYKTHIKTHIKPIGFYMGFIWNRMGRDGMGWDGYCRNFLGRMQSVRNCRPIVLALTWCWKIYHIFCTFSEKIWVGPRPEKANNFFPRWNFYKQ